MDTINTYKSFIKIRCEEEDRDKIYLEREEFSESGCKVVIKWTNTSFISRFYIVPCLYSLL